jgi:Ca-activated chloride channel family protein
VSGRSLLMTLALFAACAAGVLARQTPVFRASTDAVLVDVSVRQNGAAVTGLAAADFELLDRGVPQTIESGTLGSVPLDLTLLIDTSGSTQGGLLDRLKQAVRDTSRLLRADDRVRVLAIQHVIREVVPLQGAHDEVPVDRLTAQGGTALYDGLAAVMVRPPVTARRQLIVAYTDGDDVSSITPAARVQDMALRADAVVHFVVPRVGGATAAPPPATLQAIADRTGGSVFTIDNDASISDAFRRVLDDYRRSYLLQYVPQGVTRDGWHDIVVRVKKPGQFEVRARRGWGG